jgi:hypothetical protein
VGEIKLRAILPKIGIPAALQQFICSGSQKLLPKTATKTTSTITTTSSALVSSNQCSTTTSAAPVPTATIAAAAKSMRPKSLAEKRILDSISDLSQSYNLEVEIDLPKTPTTPIPPAAKRILTETLSHSTPKKGSYPSTFPDAEISPIITPRARALQHSSFLSTPSSACSLNELEPLEDDPSWRPGCDDQIYGEEEDGEAEAVDDYNCDLVLVSMKNILSLLENCQKCGCPARVTKRKTGAHFEFNTKCSDGHTFHWESSAKHNRQPLINVQLSAAILVTGNRFVPIERMAHVLKLGFMSNNTFYDKVSAYVKPVICSRWMEMRSNVIQKIVNQDSKVDLSGDARFDSRGRGSAKYATYTLMDCSTNEIIDFAIYQKGIESGELESKGLMVVLQRVVSAIGTDKIRALVTDRNYTVGKKLKDFFPDILHQFDVSYVDVYFVMTKLLNFQLWHVSKGAGAMIDALCKTNPAISAWSRAITNHIWYCAEVCDGDANELIRIWLSMFIHMRDIHVWKEAGVEQRCGHPEYTEAERADKNWLKRTEVNQLKKVRICMLNK